MVASLPINPMIEQHELRLEILRAETAGLGPRAIIAAALCGLEYISGKYGYRIKGDWTRSWTTLDRCAIAYCIMNKIDVWSLKDEP